jgi:iron(III) transport system substrate-binding protein
MIKKILVFKKILVLVCLGLFLGACTTPGAATEISTEETLLRGRLVIYSGRSEPLIQPVIEAFQAQYPEIEVRLKAGSNSQMANALLEERVNPQADLFIATEVFTIQALEEQGVLQAYRPSNADQLPSGYSSLNDAWFGLTRRVRVIMYNNQLVSAEEAPKSIFELTDTKWSGQVAAAGSTNGSMQAQIAILQILLGEQAAQAWLEGLLANQVTFFGGHTDVRKAVGAGEFKIGLVNHYYYYLQKAEGSPVGVIFPDQETGQLGLITNATAAGIIQGASNLPAAQAFMDFLLSTEGQKIFAELNYEYPLLPGVALHPQVQPLEGLHLANIDLAIAAQQFEIMFNLLEKVGLP